MVIEDKLANQRTTDGIYTVKRAYENLISGDTAHYNRDILRQCALNDYITPNLIYDSVRTETARKELLDNYSWANGVVQSGQKIIDRGEIVNKQTYNILESLRKEATDLGRTNLVCRHIDTLLYALPGTVPQRLL